MYPHVDLSRMFEKPRCAIHCPTEEEANILLHNIKEQFQDKFKRWDVEDNRWDTYKENTGYTMFFSADTDPTSLSFYYLDWYKTNNYEIVEFSELSNPVEIAESEMPIESILGLN